VVSKGHLLKYLEGDNEALSFAFEKDLPKLIFYAYSFLKDKELASDLVLDLFERLIHYSKEERVEKLSADPEHFKNLVYLILKNKCLDHIKVNNNRERILNDRESELTNTTSNKAEEAFVNESFAKLSEHLGDRQKEVLLLHIDGHKPTEIAENLNLSTQTVKNTLTTARGKVKVLWNDFFES
jgi:RNA polymerase sigma factor (sigma-70 family)